MSGISDKKPWFKAKLDEGGKKYNVTKIVIKHRLGYADRLENTKFYIGKRFCGKTKPHSEANYQPGKSTTIVCKKARMGDSIIAKKKGGLI